MRLLNALAALSLCGCASSNAPEVRDDLVPRIREIAKSYESYGRVDDEARWAPGLCRMPQPSRARFSASDDSMTHGRKLYFLFARHRESYVAKRNVPQPEGQTLVKEAWVPRPASDADARKSRGFGDYVPYAKKGEQYWHASEKAGLYVMLKIGAAAPDNDAGWIYATVAADRRTVTAAGRIASCIRCHEEAASDRLFGLPACREGM